MQRPPVITSGRLLVLAWWMVTTLCLSSSTAVGAPAHEDTKRPFPEIVWKVERRIQEARRVFTSPADPDVAFVSSPSGLWRTRDGGRQWRLIPRTGGEILGTVSRLVVCPARPDFVVLGSLEKGVFISHNGGDGWRRAGGVADGLASEKVHFVDFSGEDGAWNTLLACHDVDAAGISKSLDGGLHWRVIARSRYFRSVVNHGQLWVAASALADEPDNWEIVRSLSYGEVWRRRQRDVMPTAGVSTTVGPLRVVWGNRGSRLLYTEDSGGTFTDVKATPSARWSSVFVTPGYSPWDQWFWAYDPFGHGLLSGRDFEQSWQSHNRGLYVHRMIKRGANVTANVNGTRFYACVNDRLYVGEHALPPDGPVVRTARADPAVLNFLTSTAVEDARRQADASAHAICHGAPLDTEIERMFQAFRKRKAIGNRRRFGLRVRVEHPKGPDAVQSVTVTPDILGVGPVPLFDDGKHDDGGPADGLWAGTFTFSDERIWGAGRLEKDGRHAFPGVRGIPVTVADKTGNTNSWTLMFGLFPRPKPQTIWCARPTTPASTLTMGYKEGNVSIELAKTGGPAGADTLEIKGGTGPWNAHWGTRYQSGGNIDITAFKYVTLNFRGLPGSADVSFFLVDELSGGRAFGEIGAMLPKSFSNAVSLVKPGYPPVMDGKYHEIKVPVMTLVRGVRFMRRHVAGFGLRAAKGARGGTYHIDEVRLTHD